MIRRHFFLDTKTICYIIILFFVAQPSAMQYMGGQLLELFFYFGVVLSYVFILIKWIARKNISLVFILGVCVYGTALLSTVLNHGNVLAALFVFSKYIFMIMLLDSEIEHVDSVIKACIIYLSIMIFVNFITILIWPNGMNAMLSAGGQPLWFFSVKNGLGKSLLILLFFKAEYDLNKKKHLTLMFYVLAAICVLSVIFTWSASSIVGVILMVGGILLTPVIARFQPKIFNIYLFLGILLFIFIFFVIIQNVGVFSDFIKNILHKSITFNGRTPIWSISILRFLKKPILGYGFLTSQEYVRLIGLRAASDSHDFFLTLGIYGGSISVSFYIVLIFSLARSIKKNQFSQSYIIATFFMFSFFLILLFENTTVSLYWIVFAYIYSIRNKKNNSYMNPRRFRFIFNGSR